MPRPRRAVLLATAALPIALLAAPAEPAHAAPIANDDTYRVLAGGTYTLTPTDNDETTFLSSGSLTFCGVTDFDPRQVYVEETESGILVEANESFRGTSTITYEACQRNARDEATISLDVVRLADVRAARVKGARGRVRFANPNATDLRLSYGSASSGRPDTTITLPARSSVTISTRRASIYWVAFHSQDGTVVTAGDGTVAGLQKKARTKRRR
jgi:hypothetical protein